MWPSVSHSQGQARIGCSSVSNTLARREGAEPISARTREPGTDMSGSPRSAVRRLPAQHGLARGARLVEAAQAREVGGALEQLGLALGFALDLAHGVHELVERLLALGLGGLDQHRALDHQ